MSKSNRAWKNDGQNLINTLLETAKDVPEIDNYLIEEILYLEEHIPLNASVIDFGCGNGRHLRLLKSQISEGLGIDMNPSYLEEARMLHTSEKLSFEEGNIENYDASKLFDVAIAMYNTFGNIEDKEGLITSMMNSLKEDGLAIISTFSSASIAPRLKMYEMLGYQNLSIEGNTVRTEDGFMSQCFSQDELKEIVPTGEVECCSDIGWIVRIRKEKNVQNKNR